MNLRIQSHLWMRFSPGSPCHRAARSIVVGVAALLAATASSVLASGDPLRVVVSIAPYRDLVARVAPAGSVVDVLLPVGASPHGYDPTPRDLATLADADLIVMNGVVDAFVSDLVRAAGREVALFTVLDHIEPSAFPTVGETPPHDGDVDDEHGDDEHGDHDHGDDEHGDRDDHAHEHDGHASGVNAHVWLDPLTVASIVPHLAGTIASVVPDRSDEVRANAQVLVADLETVHDRLTILLEPVAGAVFVPFHDAWPWFAGRYGLDLVLEIEPFPGREPSAGELARVLDQLAETGARAIFAEAQLPSRSAEVLAEEAGVALATLDPLGGRPGLETYEELLVGNARVIVETLGR